MKQPKPILIIKVECEYCQGGELITSPDKVCRYCNGTGFQSKEIYKLEGFEKCDYDFCNGEGLCEADRDYPCPYCKHGYKIPFKDYEIKKVSELRKFEYLPKIQDRFKFDEVMEKHNLKEDDKMVIKNG